MGGREYLHVTVPVTATSECEQHWQLHYHQERTLSSRHTQFHSDNQFILLLVVIYLTCPVPRFALTSLSSASVGPFGHESLLIVPPAL